MEHPFMPLEGGFNNNPSCLQFMAIFRKLIVHSGLLPSARGNVVIMDSTQCLKLSEVGHREAAESPFNDNNLDHTYCTWISTKHVMFVSNIVTYIAGFVVRWIMSAVCCDVCKASLVSAAIQPCYELYQLLELKNEGGLVTPSQGVVYILTAAEKGIRLFMSTASAKNICSVHKVTMYVKNECGDIDPLCLGEHITESQYGIDNHYFDIIKVLVACYYTIRQKHIARLHSSHLKKKSLYSKN
ncbi:uncharacterized protein LOC108247691 [Kryptolebias marmoratus]|uniref:uncharacterized protein LOC108247691 n=1 Tax=Kryptolebias marmoratus TaxID=37003 RepID=UPI0007F87CBC|nr:uncharacterized protein LOC108247691 [Kryptolebias marmoratus]